MRVAEMERLSMKKFKKFKLSILAILVASLVLSGCSSSSEDEAAVSGECTPSELATVEPGILTIATGEPAFPPWVIDDAPESGEGFEAAVAYAVADQLGYTLEQVKWIRTTFDGAIAPGPKDFDFNIQQYSITDERKEVVDFSSSYYQANQAIVTYKGSKIDGVTTLEALSSAAPKLGAPVGTTSLEAIEDLGLTPSVFNNNADAVSALKNKQIDGIVVDLPSAFFAVAVQLDDGVIVGQIEGTESGDQGFGLLLSKDNPITGCVSQAIDALTADGTLAAITQDWLADLAGAPVLQ